MPLWLVHFVIVVNTILFLLILILIGLLVGYQNKKALKGGGAERGKEERRNWSWYDKNKDK